MIHNYTTIAVLTKVTLVLYPFQTSPVCFISVIMSH